MYATSSTRRSFLLLEMIVATVLTAGALALFALALTQFVGYNGVLMARQNAALAGEAVLNEVRAGVEPDADHLSQRFPQMTFNITRSQGAGQWQGLDLVTIEVRTMPKYGKEISVRVCGYLEGASQ